jgi:hypothetical protein
MVLSEGFLGAHKILKYSQHFTELKGALQKWHCRFKWVRIFNGGFRVFLNFIKMQPRPVCTGPFNYSLMTENTVAIIALWREFLSNSDWSCWVHPMLNYHTATTNAGVNIQTMHLNIATGWKGVVSLMLRLLYPCIYWREGWICPRAGPQYVEETNLFPLKQIKPRFLERPVGTLATIYADVHRTLYFLTKWLIIRRNLHCCDVQIVAFARLWHHVMF